MNQNFLAMEELEKSPSMQEGIATLGQSNRIGVT
jgi:hypothetical protein